MRKSKEIIKVIQSMDEPIDKVQIELLLDIRNTLVQLHIDRKVINNIA